ncbi:MAG: transcription antitermination factor NusB [Acidobacteriota bacterium]
MNSAPIAPARRAAFDILRKIGRGRGNSDTLLHSLQVDQLSAQDRNLCTTLVLGTLRWQMVLDAECRKFLARPDLDLPEDAWLALRVGAYQLLFLDRIPTHAALFESVEWCKNSEGARQTGLVNAVLRKVATLPKKRAFDAEQAYPQWLVARWRKFYGAEACRRICEQGQMEAETAVRLLNEDAANALLSQGVNLRPGAFLAGARRTADGDAKALKLPLELSAHAQLQDEGSQLVAELLGRGLRILDTCAAPGGKTAVLLQNNPDTNLLACDLHPGRLATMHKRLSSAMNLDQVEFRIADAAKLVGAGPFDRILCDVPCTGTGTLARNPEIRHRLQPEELVRQAERQREILSAVLQLLAPGGRLLYSTCSLEPEENAAVVEACLPPSNSGSWNRLNLGDEFDRLEVEGIVRGEAVEELRATSFRDGYLRTLPGLHPCDGFFAALIERR